MTQAITPWEDEDVAAGLREIILADPQVILEDPEMMRALITANDQAGAANVIDLRSVAMDRLEARLSRLEDTHRSVVAAAYENLAGMNQINRAILRMLDPVSFEDFLHNLGGEVADILRVDHLRLVLETAQGAEEPAVQQLSDVLVIAEPGFVHSYMVGGRDDHARPVILRQFRPRTEMLYGAGAGDIRSEAAMALDFGDGRLPGMLVLGSEDPHHFVPQHGTDLLAFFAGVFERAMQRWLA